MIEYLLLLWLLLLNLLRRKDLILESLRSILLCIRKLPREELRVIPL